MVQNNCTGIIVMKLFEYVINEKQMINYYPFKGLVKKDDIMCKLGVYTILLSYRSLDILNRV